MPSRASKERCALAVGEVMGRLLPSVVLSYRVDKPTHFTILFGGFLALVVESPPPTRAKTPAC